MYVYIYIYLYIYINTCVYTYIYIHIYIYVYMYIYIHMYVHQWILIYKELYVQLKWLRTPKFLLPSLLQPGQLSQLSFHFFLDLNRGACPSGPHNLSHGCETNKCDQVSEAASSLAPQPRGQPIGSDDVRLCGYIKIIQKLYKISCVKSYTS